MTVIHTVLLKCSGRAKGGFECQPRAETLVFKHHVLFIARACLTGKILHLAYQHRKSRPECDFNV